MSFVVKKTFSMKSQFINQHNQSTVETVTAMAANMLVKQMSEIKHMNTMCVVAVKFFCLFH